MCTLCVKSPSFINPSVFPNQKVISNVPPVPPWTHVEILNLSNFSGTFLQTILSLRYMSYLISFQWHFLEARPEAAIPMSMMSHDTSWCRFGKIVDSNWISCSPIYSRDEILCPYFAFFPKLSSSFLTINKLNRGMKKEALIITMFDDCHTVSYHQFL